MKLPTKTSDLAPILAEYADISVHNEVGENWRESFGSIWGNLDIAPVRDGEISGSLYSRKIGDLTFNRIEFGNQVFERNQSILKNSDEPFYSLTFPDGGRALCQIGEATALLTPCNVFLLNNGMSAKLQVDEDYSTFNVQIPCSSLENRLGRRTDILQKAIIQPDAIFHMMQRLMTELLGNIDHLDQRTQQFLGNQMLDTVAFFLSSCGRFSEDPLAIQALRAKVLAYLDANFRNPALTPEGIAHGCGISRSYLYKLFVNEEPIMERLRHRRLDAARGMIEADLGQHNMTQIAHICGFSSSSEFSRTFKARFGCAPSRFKT